MWKSRLIYLLKELGKPLLVKGANKLWKKLKKKFSKQKPPEKEITVSQHGKENLEELAVSGFNAYEKYNKALEDGKISFGETITLIGPTVLVIKKFKTAGLVLKEFKDLDDAERMAVIEKVNAEFDIPDDELESKLEEVFAMIINLSAFLNQ